MLQANRRFVNGAHTLIESGEDETRETDTYTGTRTERAIRSRLTSERCSGDRHARALVHVHDTDHGEGAYVALDDDDESLIAGPALIDCSEQP